METNHLSDFIGLIGKINEIEDSFFIVKSVHLYKDELDFHCLVATQDEKGEKYFADAVYSGKNICLFNVKIQDLLQEHKMKIGEQLSLF